MNQQYVLLARGTLWPALQARTASALASGALRPIDTSAGSAGERGIRFVVRSVSSLARKDRGRRAQKDSAGGKTANPFLPHEVELFVADILPTHFALLNKFNVIDHHLLIVTREFEHQETLLTQTDFLALCTCMAEFEALGFYNGGVMAGASQPHKHLQLVPLPLAGASDGLPVEPLLPQRSPAGEVVSAGELPFVNAFARLDPACHDDPPAMAAYCHGLYLRMLEHTCIGTVRSDRETRQGAPYNLLVTRQWMLLVARGSEFCDGISVNALGYAGSLFVRNAHEMQTVQRLGPLQVLRRVSLPRD